MQIRPYGDTANDGIVQLSFTLPLALNAHTHEIARRYAMLMGIHNPLIAHEESIAQNHTFFIIYGSCVHTIDTEQVSIEIEERKELNFDEVNIMIEKTLGR